MNTIDSASDILHAVLLTFSWGATPTVTRYTSCTNPITIYADTWLPEPSIEVTMDAQHGGAEDKPVKLRMAIRAPLDTLTSQRSHARIAVTIEEIDPNDVTTRRVVWKGFIAISRRNPNGSSGLVEIDIAGWKHAMNTSMNSWAANTTCNHNFGDQGCCIDRNALAETHTIGAIAGDVITLTGMTTPVIANYWRFGDVTVDGLAIMVRDYISGNTVRLLKVPPPAWLGQTAVIRPGCDRTPEMCDTRWHNIKRNSAFGHDIPAYNPLLEAT